MKKIFLVLCFVSVLIMFSGCNSIGTENSQNTSSSFTNQGSPYQQIDYTNILNEINNKITSEKQNNNPLQIKTFSKFGNDISTIMSTVDASVNSWISSNNNYEIIEIYPSTSIKESTNTTYRTDFLYSVTIIYKLK